MSECNRSKFTIKSPSKNSKKPEAFQERRKKNSQAYNRKRELAK